MGFDNIEYAEMTDVGVRRSHNQDARAMLLAKDEEKWRQRGHVFLVADGMGAHAVGELASELAVGIIPHTFDKHAGQGPAPGLRKAFVEANASIHARGQQNREFEGMGTTTTALIMRPEGVYVGHVGDSRCYRIRAGQIEQLSFDHSLVWEYARRQGIDPEAVHGIPSNVIVRSLGPEPLVQVDVEGPHPLQDGDIFLLCSDGLSGQVNDQEIGAIASLLPPAEACQFLVDMANLRGGPDNITVMIVRVGGASPSDGAPAEAPAPRPPWHRLPWWLGSLLGGIILALGAVTLSIYRVGGELFAFLLASAAIAAGLIGLWRQHASEQRRNEQEADQPKPKVYRRADCKAELPLVQKVAANAAALRDWVKEQAWPFDGAAFEEHVRKARSSHDQADFAGAFRDYCRAMRVLTEVLAKQRAKGESFRPIWDKERPNGREHG